MQKSIKVGVTLQVTESSFTHLQTGIPVVRASYEAGKWVALDPSIKKGLIIFVCHPQKVLNKIKELRITSVKRNVAFAVNSSLLKEIV